MIIGLTGKLESGKDTVADWLVANHSFQKVGFADELYAGVCGLFDITLEEALAYKNPDEGIQVEITSFQKSLSGQNIKFELGKYTWREFLQRFGTEMGRMKWGDDFWINRFEEKYLDSDETPPGYLDNLVVKDVRFNNEAALLGSYGGTIWEVLRPGKEGDGHESESGIDVKHIDGELMNDASIPELHEMLNWWWTEVRHG